MGRFFALVLLVASVTASLPAQADDYADARAEMVAAYQAEDFGAMRDAAGRALAARPGYPSALFNLALAQCLDGDSGASLQTLRDLLTAGVDFGVGEIPEFAPLKESLEWGDYAAAVEKLYEPVGFGEIVGTLDVSDFVPEGIAADADGRLYLGSIRHGQIVRLGDQPATVSDPANGHFSVFGMRFDGDGGLWFASSAVPQFQLAGENAGRAGLFRLGLSDGRITHSALLPATTEAQVLGDLVLAGNDIIYATDSQSGVVYRFDIGTRQYEPLVDAGVFGSPQGLVLDATGRHLYVADYIGGLHRVSVEDGNVTRLSVVANVTDFGIDGLYRYDNELIATQNGIRPHRVTGFSLSDDGLSITAAGTIASNLDEFGEPTLGFVRGKDFFVVANSHWNRFTADNELPRGLNGPIVLRIPLEDTARHR